MKYHTSDDDSFFDDIKKMMNESPQDDPYERGFADKLYEQEDYTQESAAPQQQSKPAIRAYNVDFKRETEQVRTAQDRNQPTESDTYHAARRRKSHDDQHYDDEDVPERKKKKGGFFRKLLKVLLILLLIFALIIGALLLFAKQPVAEPGLGARKDGSSTILIAGTDESGDLTDTIMLLNANRSEKQISVLSIPRDTKVNSSYSPHKINGAYGVNGKGEEGMDSLMGYVADCIGFRPDGYVLIELDVFVDLVNLLGDVEFDVPQDMFYSDPSQDLYINLTAGLQKLDGEQAMGLVRFRSGYAAADLERVNVQRAFVSAALDQWITPLNLWKMPQAAIMVTSQTNSDLTVRNLVWLAVSVALCGTDDMQMMTIPNYVNSDGYVVVKAGETLDIINAYFNPYTRDITMDDLNIAS